MERRLFFADAFPHHETCSCKACVTASENIVVTPNHSDVKASKVIMEKNTIRISDRPAVRQR
jgi:hypothetical protein